jgi:hypothetical protein
MGTLNGDKSVDTNEETASCGNFEFLPDEGRQRGPE